jgi:hypothetical protein
MAKELTSEGKCLYCNQMFSQLEIGKHLAKHLADMEKTDTGEKTQTFCHVEVEADEMFLHLLVKGAAAMKKIDNFLRDIWLECCGHLSDFGHKNFKVSMNQKVEDIFEPGVKIFHDYDYGTTTRVLLKGLKQYQMNLKESIILLSRNEPLKRMCAICKKEPAINLCTVCNCEKYSFFCESCSQEHENICDDFADYSCLPVVNSPRMGECGYTGGSIDLERDGVYKKK